MISSDCLPLVVIRVMEGIKCWNILNFGCGFFMGVVLWDVDGECDGGLIAYISLGL